MSLSTFSLSEPAVAQSTTQISSKTPPKRKTEPTADPAVAPEPR